MIDNAVGRLIAEENLDLFDELNERLDEYESFTNFTDRPVSAFILDVCDALNLDFEWKRFACDPWAAEEAKADPPASPFAVWWHSPDQDDGGEPPEVRANGHGAFALLGWNLPRGGSTPSRQRCALPTSPSRGEARERRRGCLRPRGALSAQRESFYAASSAALCVLRGKKLTVQCWRRRAGYCRHRRDSTQTRRGRKHPA